MRPLALVQSARPSSQLSLLCSHQQFLRLEASQCHDPPSSAHDRPRLPRRPRTSHARSRTRRRRRPRPAPTLPRPFVRRRPSTRTSPRHRRTDGSSRAEKERHKAGQRYVPLPRASPAHRTDVALLHSRTRLDLLLPISSLDHLRPPSTTYVHSLSTEHPSRRTSATARLHPRRCSTTSSGAGSTTGPEGQGAGRSERGTRR